MKLGFIGCGNMANAIIGGILRSGLYLPEEIIGSGPSREGRERTKQNHGINMTDSNAYVVSEAEIVFLTVKPAYLPDVLRDIQGEVRDNQLFISIIAGVSLAELQQGFGPEKKIRIVRLMPNTPALVRDGMTAVCSNALVSENDLKKIMELLSSFGEAELVPEALFDTVHQRFLPRLCLFVHRSDGGCGGERRNAEETGVSLRRQGGRRQCQTPALQRKAPG